MTICIYYKTTDKPWGGTNSFILNLKRWFLQRSITITDNIDDEYDILLVNGVYKAPGKLISYQEVENARKGSYNSLLARLLKRRRKNKVRVFFRLDGLRKIYSGIETPMDALQLRCLPLADHIIFQSEFAYGVFKAAGYNGNNYTVINNGVDQSVFSITDKQWWDGQSPLKVISCSWSENPAKGHQAIAAFSVLANVDVSFIGNWPSSITPQKVRMIKPLRQRQIAEAFKKADIFLFPALNEACSNTLLEALSCGLPVLYANSGSNKEIAERYGVPLDPDNIERCLQEIKQQYGSLVKNIQQEHKRFSIESIAEHYMKAFTSQ